MGIFRGKEGPPLELPEGYDQRRLPDGRGDESTWIPDEAFRLPKSHLRNGQLPDEESARPLFGLGKPNPTL